MNLDHLSISDLAAKANCRIERYFISYEPWKFLSQSVRIDQELNERLNDEERIESGKKRRGKVPAPIVMLGNPSQATTSSAGHVLPPDIRKTTDLEFVNPAITTFIPSEQKSYVKNTHGQKCFKCGRTFFGKNKEDRWFYCSYCGLYTKA